MIKFNAVTKTFGTITPALDNVSLAISEAEFVFLVGPSGAGKTTFLRLITRDLLPTSGQVIVNQWDTAKLAKSKIPLLRRKVTMIFQDFKILYDRTVFENIALALEILAKREKEITQAVSDTLSLVGLSKKTESFPAQLSSGELQRVSIARAIVAHPTVLLADEPTGNLDPKTGWDIIKLLSDINKLGTTIIMATHNMDIVNSLKKRVIVLKNGKLASDKIEGKYH